MSKSINIVNQIEREIIRYWNWPNKENHKFSTRPTPYNISKKLNIPSANVYRSWRSLQEQGLMNQLIILPSEYLCNRKLFLLSNVQLSDFQEMISLLNDLYFVETIHYFQVYESVGLEFMANTNHRCIAIVMNNTNENLAKRRLNLILNNLKNKEICLVYESTPQCSKTLIPNETESRILHKILYEDINRLNISHLAKEIGMNNRTMRRYLDSMVSKSYIELYPRMSQPKVLTHKVAAFSIFSDLSLKDLLSGGLIRERYLLLRKFPSVLNILIYYESTEELETCIEELKYVSDGFFVSLTFRTSISPAIKENITGNAQWYRNNI